MTHVVTDACVGHKYQDCVAVCPVEAFREADTYLVIDPDECIDCAACIPECPVDAIFADDEIPEGQENFLEINQELCEVWPVISHAPTPPDDADEWREVKNKLQYLEK